MRRLYLIAILLMAGCAPFTKSETTPNTDVWPDKNMGRYHDDQLKVTCWVYSATSQNGAMTCIPDWQLVAPKQ